MIETESDF